MLPKSKIIKKQTSVCVTVTDSILDASVKNVRPQEDKCMKKQIYQLLNWADEYIASEERTSAEIRELVKYKASRSAALSLC